MPEVPSPEADARIFEAAKSWTWERTIGLYMQRRGGNPVMTGSGVLLQIADASFVLSAAHVLKAAQEAMILVGSMSKGARLIPLPPQTTQITFTRDMDKLDIGFVRLPEVVARELAEHRKTFLRLSDLDLGNEPSGSFYSVVGYPQTTNTPDHVLKQIDALPIYYGTYAYSGTDDDSTPGVSIVLRCEQERVTTLPEGESERMPPLGGISGCGMWRLYGIGDRVGRLDTWAPTWIRLSGIEHGVAARKYIKGTLVRHVIALIANACPELRASIQLTLPA